MKKLIGGLIKSISAKLNSQQPVIDDNAEERLYQSYLVEAANRNNVVSDIHKNDFIFEVIRIHESNKGNLKKAVDQYFDDGDRSAHMLADLISDFSTCKTQPCSLFEFAAGYGCVTRHMNKYLKDWEITSCDIHKEAIAFIEKKLGMRAALSDTVPEKLAVPDNNYDVVFALSFFSHMPKQTWSRWVQALLSKLKDGGILIFTAHGATSKQYFDLYYKDFVIDSEGFLFISGSEQHDLDTSDYGQTLTMPSFVNNVLNDLGVKVVHFKEGYWWGHQDLYVVQK